MKFSVIIAARNEGAQIAQSLKRLRQISPNPVEIILVDGGSDDGTPDIAKALADRVIVLPKPNRGAQLDAGARQAAGDILLFLRPDAQLPGSWQQVLEHFWLANHKRKVSGTAFRVDYGGGRAFRLASRVSNARVSLWQVAGGDHGVSTTPENYRLSGGYPPFPCLEDVVFSQRLRALGEVVLLPETVWPAARRLRQVGPVSHALSHLWLTLRYKLGVSPEKLWESTAQL